MILEDSWCLRLVKWRVEAGSGWTTVDRHVARWGAAKAQLQLLKASARQVFIPQQ